MNENVSIMRSKSCVHYTRNLLGIGPTSVFGMYCLISTVHLKIVSNEYSKSFYDAPTHNINLYITLSTKLSHRHKK